MRMLTPGSSPPASCRQHAGVSPSPPRRASSRGPSTAQPSPSRRACACSVRFRRMTASSSIPTTPPRSISASAPAIAATTSTAIVAERRAHLLAPLALLRSGSKPVVDGHAPLPRHAWNTTARRSSAGRCRRSGASVQGRLTEAIGKFSGETVSLRGAGRTDAGVHALGQVAHFDLARAWPVDTVRAAVNFHLKPDPIAVLDCAVVADDFDARFSATARHYLYRILARPAPPVLDRDRVWWVPQRLRRGGDAAKPPRRWSAGTTSRRSAPPAARPSRRSRRSTAWR